MMRLLVLASCLLFVLFLFAQVRTARAETCCEAPHGETVISMTSYPSAELKPSGTW